MSFLHPALLYGLPLVLVPIVVHLLNRRRFQRRPWGAMAFLTAAAKRSRKRVLLEHWVVLLLRTLAILAVILMVARPRSAEGWAGDGPVRRVVLLDDSASTRERSSTTTVFQRECEALQRWLAALAEERPGDWVEVSLLSRPDRPLIPMGPLREPVLAELARALEDLKPRDLPLSPPALVADRLERMADAPADAGDVSVHLFTDFRHRDWIEVEDPGGDPSGTRVLGGGASIPWTPGAKRLIGIEAPGGARMVSLKIHPVRLSAAASAPHLGIAAIELRDRVMVPGRPVRLDIRVEHRQAEPRGDAGGGLPSPPTQLEWSLLLPSDEGVGALSALRADVPELAPGESVTIPLEVSPPTSGHVAISARLPGDRYPPDDRRFLVLPVPDQIQAWIVAADPESDLPFHLAAALDPEGDGQSGISTEMLTMARLLGRPPGAAEMVWVCDPPTLGEAFGDWLRTHLKRGGGAVLVAGPNAQPRAWREVLGQDGLGLWPGRVMGDVQTSAVDRRLMLADPEHPLVEIAPESLVQVLERTCWVRSWRPLAESGTDAQGQVGETAGGTAPPRVVLRLDDARRTPVWMETTAPGQGCLTLVGLHVDPSWTNLSATPAWLVLQSELLRVRGRSADLARWNHDADGILEVVVDPVRSRPDIRLIGPEGTSTTRTAVLGEQDAARVTFPLADAGTCGVLRLQRLGRDGRPSPTWLVARNGAWSEGDLRPMVPAELRASWPSAAWVQPEIAGVRDAGGEIHGDPWWRWVAVAGVLCLVLESVLVRRFAEQGHA